MEVAFWLEVDQKRGVRVLRSTSLFLYFETTTWRGGGLREDTWSTLWVDLLDHDLFTPHSWSTLSQKATSIATNYIQFSSFSWAFTWYHSWKEWCGSKSYIFNNLMNYFLKLLCFFIKHKHCQVGKIDQFLTINQLIIQITENLNCQQRPLKPVNRALYTTKFLWNQPRLPSIQQNWNLEEELLPKTGGRAGPIWSWPTKLPNPSF
jgi:hypothetical protein